MEHLLTLAGWVLALWTQTPDLGRLVEQLGSDSGETRERAESRLISEGPGARSAVEPLLQSPDAERRIRAARILKFYEWGLTPPQKQAIDALLEECGLSPRSDDGQGRDRLQVDPAAEKQWKEWGSRPIRYLLDLHQAAPAGRRRGQILSLARFSEDPAVLQAALTDATSPVPALSDYAALVCTTFKDPRVVPILAGLLGGAPGDSPMRPSLAESAAWALQEIVGFPIDPEQWIEEVYPYVNEQRGFRPRLDRFQCWWQRNEKRTTVAEWRQAAREDAREQTGASRSPRERLSGCMLLMALGGDDDRLCRTLVEICGRTPKTHDDFLLRWYALGFFEPRTDPENPFLGRPWERIEDLLMEILSDNRMSSDFPAALGVAWRLYGGIYGYPIYRPSFYGVEYPLERLRPILIARLGSADPEVRYLASLTLGFMGEPRAEASLIEFIQAAGDEEARNRHPWLHSAATWTQATSGDGGPFELWALGALLRIGSDASKQTFQRCARKGSTRLIAFRGLARLGDRSILPQLLPYLDAPPIVIPEGGSDLGLQARDREGDRGAAFMCFYQVEPKDALAWLRRNFPTSIASNFLSGEALMELVERKDPLAVELWLSSGDHYSERLWDRLPTLSPEIVIPVLLEHASRGSLKARNVLGHLASGEARGWSSDAEVQLWLERSKSTFKLDPAAFCDK